MTTAWKNIRRISEVAKVFVSQGIITFVSAITPRGELRDLARGILGKDLIEVYIKASYELHRRLERHLSDEEDLIIPLMIRQDG